MIPELEVLVAAYGVAGLRRILSRNWPQVPGVRYLVCCQNPDGDDLLPEAEALHARGDTIVLFFRDRGLSRNRNHCLAAASAPFLLIMDDDLDLDADGLAAIIAAFVADPALDFLTVCADLAVPGSRRLPPPGHDLSRSWPFYWPISFEIALRRASVESVGARFSLLAGIGAPVLAAGEENLFVHSLIRAGLRGVFSGIRIGVHDHATTSEREALNPALLKAKGAVMRITRGSLPALVRLPLEARRAEMPFIKALGALVGGYLYSIKHRRDL